MLEWMLAGWEAVWRDRAGHGGPRFRPPSCDRPHGVAGEAAPRAPGSIRDGLVPQPRGPAHPARVAVERRQDAASPGRRRRARDGSERAVSVEMGQLGQAAAEHDHLGIEQVDDARQGARQAVRVALQGAAGGRVPGPAAAAIAAGVAGRLAGLEVARPGRGRIRRSRCSRACRSSRRAGDSSCVRGRQWIVPAGRVVAPLTGDGVGTDERHRDRCRRRSRCRG